MKKVHIDNLNKKQMEYAFAKNIGILLCDDTVVIRNDIGFLSVYHLTRFNVCDNFELLNMALKEKLQKIDVEKKNNSYVATFKGLSVKNENKNIAMIKVFLLYKAKYSGGLIDIPERLC